MAAPVAGAEGAALHVAVLSPEQAVYEGPATQVIAPAFNGQLGILHGHAPLMALLGEGVLRVDNGGQTLRFNVSGGFLQVVDNTVTVMSERAVAV
jgi:F-type H+-transporting ATPase subunit epsilon